MEKSLSYKCRWCGADANFETINVGCSGQWTYYFKCPKCKKTTSIKGPDPKELKNGSRTI